MTEENKFLVKLRKQLVILKFTLIRGYAWCQLPAMSLMGAGVLFPYVRVYLPWIKMWSLAIIACVIMMTAGYIDRRFKLLHEEQNYATETNPTLMAGLRGELNKDKESMKIRKILTEGAENE